MAKLNSQCPFGEKKMKKKNSHQLDFAAVSFLLLMIYVQYSNYVIYFYDLNFSGLNLRCYSSCRRFGYYYQMIHESCRYASQGWPRLTALNICLNFWIGIAAVKLSSCELENLSSSGSWIDWIQIHYCCSWLIPCLLCCRASQLHY